MAQKPVDSTTRTAVGAGLEADESSHHRVKTVDRRRRGVPQVHLQEGDELGGRNPPQLPAHVLEAVELLPGGPVQGEPFRARHTRMIHDRVERIVVVQIRVQGRSAGDGARVVLRARQRRQHEERRDIGVNLVGERAQIVAYDGRRVVREADDVSDVGQNAGGVPGLDQGGVVFDAVLSFSSIVQTVGIENSPYR